ncbi:MarR family transcriptional regulator [Anaerofustis stercorihominis]|uniref:MarR family winged helix-turn-helix transcriptional regulator n=1 Tax=Anaerofustis stercorihominis TaxID=214853 RepID=UPI00210B275A|nr:MarR family transcriptional regulator [Anaerofustis stercorihominis]MCQ4794206.1 MarR family transcriptional regulator [Anaerofustis stercorihominis]
MKLPNYDNEHLIFGLFFMLSNKLQVLGDSFYEEITVKQWFVLVVIDTFKEEYPSLSDVAEMVGSSHQNVKQIVNKLTDKGYLQIVRDENDKRRSLIKMTDKCEKLQRDYKEKENEFMTNLFKGTKDEDLKKVVEVFLRLSDNIEEMKNE